MTSAQAVLSGLDEQTTARHEALYMHLHQNPELSMQEHETSAEIARRLEGFGYEVQLIGGGVVGVLVNGPGMTVLFRADMDAMPVTEATGLPYASTKTVTDAAGSTVGVMHACAHDAHVTCGLGAAELGATARCRTWASTPLCLQQRLSYGCRPSSLARSPPGSSVSSRSAVCKQGREAM